MRPRPPASLRRRPASRGPTRTVALLGNPNTGKTTLFNALTGLRQKVANYPGVTVEKKVGSCVLEDGRRADLLDLPGSYSLHPVSPDERIVRDVLLGLQPGTPPPDMVVLVLDVMHLERHLYLALQVIELRIPVVLALNMMDVAAARGVRVDQRVLERRLGVPVVGISATTGEGLQRLRRLMASEIEPPAARSLSRAGLPEARLDDQDPGKLDEVIRSRYQVIGDVLAAATLSAPHARVAPQERADRILTHRVLGPAFFLLVMGAMFQSVFAWAQPAMDAIDFLMAGLGTLAGSALPEGPVRSLLVDGVIAGVGSALVFVPQIAVLFLFLSILEDSGYMARAAFIMDRVMGRFGLSGRAFIPLLSSFACAIPGILATRTIENRRDRLTTIMVAPFMSCSARLPVYALLIGAFIPHRWIGPVTLPGLTLLSLYVLGILAAILVAGLLKRTVLRGGQPLHVMELPPYRMPSWRNVALTVWDRSFLFLRKAGTVILAVTIVLWFLASYPRGGPEAAALGQRIAAAEQSGDRAAAARLQNDLAAWSLRQSYAGRIGHAIEPLIQPLGFDWRIGIGLVTSLAAREVMVSTMATVFHLGDAGDHPASLRETLRTAVDPATGRNTYTPLIAVSLMVFFALACQCMSTVAVARRETNSWRWPLFMLVAMNGLAWIASFAVFQGGRLLGLG